MIGSPLRFCLITTFYPPYSFGGDGIFVYHLAHALAREGHWVEVIHCVDAYQLLSRQGSAKISADHPNVTVHRLKSSYGFLSPLATQQTGFPLFKSTRIRQVLDKGFDVIHYHNISLVGGPKILEYGQGIKLYTMHEYWLVCPTHGLFRFNRTVCTQPHCFLCSLTYKRPPQWWRYLGLLEAAVKHVDVFIAPSRFSQALHRQMGFKVPIVHLPNFVPSSEAALPTSGQSAGEAPEQPYFLFVGRLEKLKGLQTLIPVFQRYGKAQLWIAGTGSYEPQLRQLAEGSANIRFLGHLFNGQLQALYRQAIAVIVPSVCFEAFSLVTIEAFGQQTPAIVRDLGGMPELIAESGGGFVYTTDEELVRILDQLVSDPSFRRKLGLCGYRAYLQKWTTEAHLQGYLGLIHEIATTRVAGRAVATALSKDF